MAPRKGIKPPVTAPQFERTFSEDFDLRIKDIRKRADACGISIAELCRRAGVSRSTPDRWFERIPKSIVVVDLFIDELTKEEEKRQERRDMLDSMTDEERGEFLRLEREEKKAK